ncbi:putative Mid2 domain-containing protein [Seiridium cardinale]
MSAACYFASGDTTGSTGQTYIPCNSTAVSLGQHSACCAPGDMCFTNGLCKAGTGQWNWNWRVGCTDPTFSDPACPDYCRGVESDDAAHLVFQCSDDETWCCATGNVDLFARNYNFTCCDNDDLTTKLGPAVFYGTAAVSIAISTLASSTVATLTDKSSTEKTTSSSQQQSLSTIDAGSFSILTSASVTSTSILGSPTSTVASVSETYSSKALPIGLGVGIPVGLLVIALVGFLFFRLGRSQSRGASELQREGQATKNSSQLVATHPDHTSVAQYRDASAYGFEIDSRNLKAEMAHRPDPVELGSETAVYEARQTRQLIQLRISERVWQGKTLKTNDPGSVQEQILITANLHELLLELRNRRYDDFIWIDAICINQRDSAEKSMQIPLMRNIYEEAKRVLVWLGPADNVTKGALRVLTNLTKTFEGIDPRTYMLTGITWRHLSRRGPLSQMILFGPPWGTSWPIPGLCDSGFSMK